MAGIQSLTPSTNDQVQVPVQVPVSVPVADGGLGVCFRPVQSCGVNLGGRAFLPPLPPSFCPVAIARPRLVQATSGAPLGGGGGFRRQEALERKNLPTRPRFRGPQTSSPAQPSRWDPPLRATEFSPHTGVSSASEEMPRKCQQGQQPESPRKAGPFFPGTLPAPAATPPHP